MGVHTPVPGAKTKKAVSLLHGLLGESGGRGSSLKKGLTSEPTCPFRTGEKSSLEGRGPLSSGGFDAARDPHMLSA